MATVLPLYFSNITLRTDLLTFGVTGAELKIAGEMLWLPAYFDNPETVTKEHKDGSNKKYRVN